MDDANPHPQIGQIAVAAVCDAFGWQVALKAGHAAKWAKTTRTKLGLELAEFVEVFTCHYGRRDPGAGEWWAYRELYPMNKVAGTFPTPQQVLNSWGRWQLPVAVQVRAVSAVERMLAYAEELERGNR